MNPGELLTYFEHERDAMLEVIRRTVEFETPSDNKPRLDEFAARLAERWAVAGEQAGAQVEIIDNPTRGNHIRAVLPARGAAAGLPPALVLCHYDTVWPVGSLATHPFRTEEGKAYGPGIFDMQTSLVLVEFVLRSVADLGLSLARPVVVLATSDEEIGSGSSRELIEHEAAAAAHVLVLESPLPGGVLKTARKGTGSYTIETNGRAAHAGVDPDKGISAITEMAHQVLEMQALGDREQGTTVSVGVIAGGSATNVIPARCTAQVDVRAWTQSEAERIDNAIHGLQAHLAGASVSVTGGWNRPPLEHRATQALYARVRAVGAQLGLDLREGSTGGGSDGNFTGALGIPTLDGLGVPGNGAHADHEHIEVDAMPGRAALLAAILVQV